MRSEDLIDLVQTAALATIMIVLLWGMALLRRELFRASAALDAALRGQKEIQDKAADLAKRVEELEKKQRASLIGWLRDDDEPDDDARGFSRAMPPIKSHAEGDGE
jgi:hypothetical protein